MYGTRHEKRKRMRNENESAVALRTLISAPRAPDCTRLFPAIAGVSPFGQQAQQVQVDLEDPRLRQLGFEAARDDQLAQLADGVARRRQVQVLRQLLRDGAPAANRLPFLDVVPDRNLQLLHVDPLVLPEGVVFGDEHGALQVLRDARVGDPHLVMTERLALLRGFAFAQLSECGRLRIGGRQDPALGQRQVDVREEGEHERGERAQTAKDGTAGFHGYPATTILIRLPTTGGEFSSVPFMIASVAGLITPPERSAIDCHESPWRTT